HAVTARAREPRHLLVERGHEDLRTGVAQSHTETKALYRIEVAFEGHRVAGETLAQQRNELAYLRDRPVGVARAVPLPRDCRRRDADAEIHGPVAGELLQRRRGHGVERRRAQLE